MLVELELPERVNLGDAVPITVRVRNERLEPAELALTGRPIAFDVVVQNPDGREIWRRLRGATVSMMLQVRVLRPGESVEFRDEWDQRDNAGRLVEPGTYRVRGMVAGDDGPLQSAPLEIVISS